VRTEQAGPRELAAVRTVSTAERLSADIIRLLGQVWPLLCEQGTRTGHNVVIYRPGADGTLTIDTGVEVFTGSTGKDAVRRISTPGGEVAATAHFGTTPPSPARTRPSITGASRTAASRPG